MIVAAGLVAVLAVALYAPLRTAPFLYDDLPYVRDNLSIQDPANLVRFWTSSYPPGRPELGLYRPVTATAYLVDHQLYGLDSGRFHLTNAVLHGGASALAVLVTLGLGASLTAASLAGALFAVHPLHTEAVAWIVGRAEILAAIGCFGAVLAWQSFRRSANLAAFAGAMALYLFALGAKETAAPLPAAVLLAEVLGLGSRPPVALVGTSAGRRDWKRVLAPYLGFVAVFAVYVILRVHAVGQFSMLKETTAFAGTPTAVRLSSAIAIIGEYIRLMVAPVHLRVDYSDFRFATLVAPRVVLGVLAVVGSAGIAWRYRRRAPLVTFWVGWFFLFVLVFANLVVPIGAVAAERFAYIASLSVCALAGLAAARGLADRRPTGVRVVTGLVTAVLLVAMSVATLARNRDWQDPIRFFSTEVERSPRSEKAHLNLATALWDKAKKTGDDRLLRDAEAVFTSGIALRRPSERTVTGDHARLVYQYANYLQERGRTAEALPRYASIARLLEEHPILKADMSVDFHVWYGAALEAAGRPDDAIAQYEVALARRPDWIVPLRNIGQILMKQGRQAQAIATYRKALSADPTFAVGYVNLGILLAQRSQEDAALEVFATFRQAVPETAENAYYQGFLAQRLGRLDEARRLYERALDLEPGRADARAALAALR